MNRSLWYAEWLVAWFIAFVFVVVPLSNLPKDGGAVSGVVRGLILTSAVVVLFLGVRFIYRKFRDTATDDAGVRHRSIRGATEGMSDREAALVASAREEAFGATAAVPRDVSARKPSGAADTPKAKTGAHSGHSAAGRDHEPPSGVMKSAGNPAVRRAFAQAMKEVDSRTCEPGLWAMALVECNGDEKAARIAYMRQRAVEIVWTDARAAASTQDATQRDDTGARPRR